MQGSYTIIGDVKNDKAHVDLAEHIYEEDGKLFIRHELHLRVGKQTTIVLDVDEVGPVVDLFTATLKRILKRTEAFEHREAFHPASL